MNIVSKPALLLPVHVPWQVSPSESIFRFSGNEGNVVLEFLAYLGQHEALKQQSDITSKGREPTDEEFNRLGYRVIELSFPALTAFQMRPEQRPGQLIDEAAYDWSNIPLRELKLTSYTKWRKEYARYWAESGVCPDPRFYSVDNSSLIDQFGLTTERHVHWILLGHDAYFEVVGSEFSWRIIT